MTGTASFTWESDLDHAAKLAAEALVDFFSPT